MQSIRATTSLSLCQSKRRASAKPTFQPWLGRRGEALLDDSSASLMSNDGVNAFILGLLLYLPPAVSLVVRGRGFRAVSVRRTPDQRDPSLQVYENYIRGL